MVLSMEIDEAIRRRISIRAFKPDPVPLALVHEILDLARRAPSGTNIQPWSLHVVAGAVRDELVREVLAYREVHRDDNKAEFPRTAKRKEPYVGRMRKLGKDMYALIGIPKGDEVATWRQWGRNYAFFDAPVGLIFTMDKDLDVMSYLDVGLFMQSIMLLATARGLGTCSQGAWNQFHAVTRRVLNVPDSHYIVCGMSLGYPDPRDPVNSLLAEREPVEAFTVFHGFEETPA